jgi:uncharacterized protein (DUF2236 family)
MTFRETLGRPAHGWQPDSVGRRINREVVVLLGWGRAILLQVAHPLVAAAVADHSHFRQNPIGYIRRAHRTVDAMLSMTFRGEEEMRATAARINEIHAGVHGELRDATGFFPAGTPYSATDPHLLLWVHATLVDSLLLTYEQFVGPLTAEEKNQYCAEAAAVAPLLNLPRVTVPDDVTGLDRYMRDMMASGEIEVTATARTLADALLAPPLGPAGFLFRPARLSTIGLLPPAIREAYGFSWGPRQERSFRRLAMVFRRTRAILPPILREWPVARAHA